VPLGAHEPQRLEYRRSFQIEQQGTLPGKLAWLQDAQGERGSAARPGCARAGNGERVLGRIAVEAPLEPVPRPAHRLLEAQVVQEYQAAIQQHEVANVAGDAEIGREGGGGLAGRVDEVFLLNHRADPEIQVRRRLEVGSVDGDPILEVAAPARIAGW